MKLWIPVCLVTAVIVILWISSAREPRYHGRTLHQWYAEVKTGGRWRLESGTQRAIPPADDPAFAAIIAMGKDAAPFLVRELGRSETPLHQRVRGWADRWLGVKLEPIDGPKAYWCLIALGTNAEVVVPEVITIAKTARRTQQQLAVWLLGDLHLRPEITIPALEEILRQSEPEYCWQPASSLAQFGPAAKSAVPLLFSKLRGMPSACFQSGFASDSEMVGAEARREEGAYSLEICDRRATKHQRQPA